MTPSLDIYAVLYFVGLALSLFWAFALLGIKKANRTANSILAGLLFLISVGIASNTLYHTGYILRIPHLIEIVRPIDFIYPPLFFLYVKSLITKEIDLRKQALHFIPALVVIGYFVPFYIESSDYKAEIFMSGFEGFSNEAAVISSLILLQESVYIVLSLILLLKHSRSVRLSYSSLDRVDLRWTRNLIIAYILVVALYFVLRFLDPPFITIRIGPIAVVLFIYVLGYMGIRQPAVFAGPNDSAGKGKYQKSGLTEERANQFLQKLTQLMETEKFFVNSNLTLQQVAGRLSLSTHNLSQLLNEKLNRNFYDFINQYRVEEAKEQLLNSEKKHFTILAIAYEVGFNSKSHFNSAFKKHVNMTPSQFRKQLG